MHIRPWWALLMAASPTFLAAQASPYIPLDDPRLPLIEHLITRGDLADPSPMVRPFRRIDLLRAIDAAALDSTTPSGRLALGLRNAYRQEDTEAWAKVEGRAGVQAYSNARVDVLHPQGPDGVEPYADLGLTGVFGPVVAVTRPALERRLSDDPTWPGRTNLEVVFRMREAYLSAQFKWFSLFFGDLQRQWGPVGQPGISLSPYSYARTSWGLFLGKPSLNLRALGAELRDEVDSLGNTVHRYWFGHRFAANLSSRFQASLWATVVLAGVDQNFTARWRNPVSILLLSNTYGQGDDGNIMVGTDLYWRAADWLTLEAQIGIDDLQYQDRSSSDRFPDRLAGTLAAYGPLGRALTWRVLYTRASSLAFRAQDPFQTFVDADVGIGRNFADNDLLKVVVGIPVRGHWVVAPEAVILRQGEGRLTDPIPANAGTVPQIFIGTVETTYRLGLTFSGRRGMLDVQTNLGLNHVRNAGHQSGRSVTEFRGWLQATLALDWQGAIK